MSLTQPQQIQSFLSCSNERACVLSALFNKIFPIYSITSTARITMSLSQCAHESQLFTRYQENLNYSAEALMKTWPSHFRTKTIADKFARRPEAIANYVYYRASLGNTEPGDGWAFRGSGSIQLTGKSVITDYANFKGFHHVLDVAKLLRENDEYAIDSACWFMAIHIGILDEMDRGEVEQATRLINGGIIGLNERKKLYDKAKHIFL